MIPESDKIIWTVTDPQDRKVVLKKSTLDFHIAGTDHDKKDRDFRKKLLLKQKNDCQIRIYNKRGTKKHLF